ncbi:hypothetical protein [Orlajensenia leifsoniae]|nr:hypothetical protein [Leifsonia flava]
MDIHAVAKELNAALGPTLVAALTGSKDTKLPIKWAKPDGTTPGPDFNRRLKFAHRMWRAIEAVEGEHVARAFFIGSNPSLGERTPLTAIREDDHSDVAAAVDNFLRDQPA